MRVLETKKGAHPREASSALQENGEPASKQLGTQFSPITPALQALRRADNDRIVANFPKNSHAEFRIVLRDDGRNGHVVIQTIVTDPRTGRTYLKSGLGISVARIPQLLAALEQAVERAGGGR